ncbi:MAG: peptide chain release factor N(5)-glutamine methyltransferase [Paludibacteraceae bacterium]
MQQFKNHIYNSLSDIYSEKEIHVFTFLILEKITGLSNTRLLSNSDLVLSESQKEEAKEFISRLKQNEPIQYILGETVFFGLNFNVNPSTLIPRPETEELIEWIKTNVSSNLVEKEVLDIGTGSGCIAVTLKKLFPNAGMTAMDISAEALVTAKQNAELNGVEIDFAQVDVLQIKKLNKKYDIIVSNPPYVLESDKKNMQHNVLDYEPHIALFVTDSDPLIYYRKIAELARNHLSKTGMLYFEIHNKQGENCKKLLHSLGFKSIILRKDISGNDRMVCATL